MFQYILFVQIKIEIFVKCLTFCAKNVEPVFVKNKKKARRDKNTKSISFDPL